jgi:hypothetical protein
MVAVSSSGFTDGALKKAARYGIIARDLRALTDIEIQSWGQQISLTLYFYQYSDLKISLYFAPESIPNLSSSALYSEIQLHPIFQSFFNAAAQKLDDLKLIATESVDQPVSFKLRLEPIGLQLCGETVIEAGFTGRAYLTSKDIAASTVFAYGQPSADFHSREATIEAFQLATTNIIHHDTKISTFLDISGLEMPPFCQFRFFRVIGGGGWIDHDSLEIVGLEKLWVKGTMKIGICSKENNQK